MTRVKICGITNLDDARVAVEAGADAVGFIFVDHTPRFMTPAQVAPIVQRLPPFVTAVGVFWNHPSGHVKAVVEACGLRAIQLHGDEKAEDWETAPVPVIKTIKLPPATTRPGELAAPIDERIGALWRTTAAAILFDSDARWSEGQTREPIAWQAIRRLGTMASSPLPIVLSGGLTPDNVARAVEIVRPYAVDVNSGVEVRPGTKDPDKVRRFVAAAKAAA